MIPPPACQERAYESEDQARSCISSRSHHPSGGEPWAVNNQVVGMIPPPDCQLEAGLEIVTPSYFLIHAHGQSASGRLSQVMG